MAARLKRLPQPVRYQLLDHPDQAAEL